MPEQKWDKNHTPKVTSYATARWAVEGNPGKVTETENLHRVAAYNAPPKKYEAPPQMPASYPYQRGIKDKDVK
jgi:hypothetical protein